MQYAGCHTSLWKMNDFGNLTGFTASNFGVGSNQGVSSDL
jgi:hypothetical protein